MKTATFSGFKTGFLIDRAKCVLTRGTVLASMMVLLAACQSTGNIGDPISRRAGWVDFIGGGDLRRACTAGSPNSYRLVYNANREDQVRIYDLTETAEGGTLRVRVLTGKVRLDGAILGSDFLRSFQPEDTVTQLEPRNVDLILQAMQADGVFVTPPEEQKVLSEWHFWVISACRNGQYLFDMRVDPTPPLETLAFPEALKAVDFAAAPYPSPPPDERRERHDIRVTEDFKFRHYELDVYPDRIEQGYVYGTQRP